MPGSDDALLLQMSVDIRSLEKQIAKAQAVVDSGAGKIEQRAKDMAAHVEKTFAGMNVAEALEKTFSRARLGVLEEGGAKIGIFGNALEALGPAGLAAAGGIFAATEAMEKAKQAAEWAEGIEQAADRLGVSMQKMQQLDFAGASIGLKPEELREQLDGVNDLLGKMQAGEPKAKMLMTELGFTPAQVQSFRTVDEFLGPLADHLAKAGSAAEQANIADKGGFGRLVPLLREGTKGFDELSAEAQRSGIVLGDDVVRGAAAANKGLNEMKAEMDGEVRRVFIDMVPVVKAFEFAIYGAAKMVGDLVQGFKDLAGIKAAPINDFQKYADQYAGLQKRIDALKNPTFGSVMTGRTDDDLAMLMPGGRGKRIAQLQAQADEAYRNLQGVATIKTDDEPPKARQLIDPKEKKAKAAPHDPTPELDKSATDAADTAAKELAVANAALVKDIMAHAEAERNAVDADTTKKLADLKGQEVKIQGEHNNAHAASQLALVQKAELDTQAAAEAKKELISRQANMEALAANISLQDEINQNLSQAEKIRAALALSTFQRFALEKHDLSKNQERELTDFDATTREKLAENQALPQAQQDGALAGERAQQRSAIVQRQHAEGAQLDHDQASPWEAWAEQGQKAAADVSLALQSEAVKEIDSFNDGLAEAITSGKSMGDVFHGIFTSMESDAIRYLAKQAEIGIFGATAGGLNLGGFGSLLGLGGAMNSSGVPGARDVPSSAFAALDAMSLPAFAGGTDDTPGGPTIYDEKGTEGYVPPGAQIIPNSTLKGLAAMGTDGLTSNQNVTMNHNISIDLTGANGDEAINRAVAAGALQAVQVAIAHSTKQLQKAQQASRRSLIGR